MVTNLKSCCRHHADDCILYRKIKDHSDFIILQEDLNRLALWSKTWELRFNTDKCKIMHLSRQQKAHQYNYKLYGQPLMATTEENYLGITVNKHLSWSSHVSNIIADANRKLGVINRVFGHCAKGVKVKLYRQIVLPSLSIALLCGILTILVSRGRLKKYKNEPCVSSWVNGI